MKALITIIAAIDQNNAIGYKNQLLFHLPADLKRFKTLTTGHTIIMGRNTFNSLPKGALPNRRNIVLSRQTALLCQGAEVFHSLSEALAHCEEDEKVFIIGGASVYEQAISIADELCLTEVQGTAKNADAFFPMIDKNKWTEKKREIHLADERHAYNYNFVDYIRKIED